MYARGTVYSFAMARVRHKDDAPVVTFSSLLRDREFLALWLTDVQSSVGDQLARVALAVLVYRATGGSGLATAAVYALTYLPAVVGGLVLSGLADRYPRRAVLVIGDLVRASLVAAMALHGLSIGVLYLLLVGVVLAGAPYKAAEPALVADLFDDARYTTASGLRSMTMQVSQLVGFGIGGAIVALIGARATLLLDAVTFAVSATVLASVLRPRPPVDGVLHSGWAQLRAGVTVVARAPRLRVLLGLAWLAGWWVVPEGLAVPYAVAHGGGPTAAGLLLAANPTGALAGALVLSRWTDVVRRVRLIGPLAVASGLPLAACAFDPGLVGASVLWALSGAMSAYLVIVFPCFVTETPPALRGQAIGLGSAGLLTAQGLGLLLGGLLTTTWSVPSAVALAGVAGVACALPLALAWARSTPTRPAATGDRRASGLTGPLLDSSGQRGRASISSRTVARQLPRVR